MLPFEDKVYTYIRENSLIRPGLKLLLSLSAGKDSMAMLHVLAELAGMLEISGMGIFHLNHKKRGRDSDDDYDFVGEAAEKMGLTFFGTSYDFSNKDDLGRSFEEYARDVRYSMLSDIAEKNEYDLIATAHNLEDNAETVLMRLFQGSGIVGLRGIMCKRDNIIRPLRICSIDEIKKYLADKHIKWREDLSNNDMRYRRNYVRAKISPLIKAGFPSYAEALHGLGVVSDEQIKLTDSLITAHFGSGLIKYDEDGSCLIEVYKIDYDRALTAHVLSAAIRSFGLFVTAAILNEIWRKYKNAEVRSFILYKNADITIRKIKLAGKPYIRLHKTTLSDSAQSAQWKYKIFCAGDESTVDLHEAGLSCTVKICAYADFEDRDENSANIFVSLPNDDAELVLRNRRDGDRIQLETGTKKIKEILIEKKLDSETKNKVPILLVNSRIAAIITSFAAAGHNRIAKEFLVSKNSRRILCIQIIKCAHF